MKKHLGTMVAVLLWAAPTWAGHTWVAGIAGMNPYSGTMAGTFAACTHDSASFSPAETYACTANSTDASNQSVLIESMWFDTSATTGVTKLKVHLASGTGNAATTLWKYKVACNNEATSFVAPTFGADSASFTCTNDTTDGKEIACEGTANLNSASNLGGANLAYTCFWHLRRFTGGSQADGTAINIIGYELDIQ